MEVLEKLALFSELISCNQPLYLWQFDSEGELLESNCPYAALFLPLFRHDHNQEYIFSIQKKCPILLSNDIGFTWVAERLWAGDEPGGFAVVGPCFLSSAQAELVEKRLRGIYMYNSGTREWKARLLKEIGNVPFVSFLLICQFAVMLHFCLCGEKITSGEIHFQTSMESIPETTGVSRDPLRSFRAERALLHVVREGDVDYSGIKVRAQNSAVVPVYTGDSLQDHKILCSMFTGLCSRAAIEGGLSAELGFSLADQYIREIWEEKSIAGVAAANGQMIQDFVAKVHKTRENKSYSPMVKSCIDYIELNLEKPMDLETLASRLGYTKYYLSRSFKQELGITVNEYIKIAKIERAKIFLANTDDSIDSILERLGFSSRSYFSDTFHKIVGKTATQYRAEHKSF